MCPLWIWLLQSLHMHVLIGFLNKLNFLTILEWHLFFWLDVIRHTFMLDLNSVQKLCGTGFLQFLLLYVIFGPTSLWESYSCRPPLISPADSVPVRAYCKALISHEKSRNWQIRQQTKTIWNALHERIWKWQYFHYNIWEWLFQLARNLWEIIKRDYTPYIWKIRHWSSAKRAHISEK